MSQPNPYASPSPFADRPDPAVAAPVMRGDWLPHVRIVAIMMGVQGGLECVFGLGLTAVGVFFPVMMQDEMAKVPDRGDGPPPEVMMWMVFGVYAVMGLVHVAAGVLHIWAAVRNYFYRSRVLGIVALSGGVATAIFCWCGITAIPLCIYGLIVYLNPEVAYAFSLTQQGYKPDQIRDMLGGPTLPPK